VDPTIPALTSFVSQVLPEVVLGLVACVLFLGSTWKPSRKVWGTAALLGLALAGAALAWVALAVPTLEAEDARRAGLTDPREKDALAEALRAIVYAAPLQLTRLGLFFKVLALAGGAVLVLIAWNDPDDEHAGEYHGCLLLIVAGTALVGSANDLITLFLALELTSIPTYILLYLPRTQPPAQEAAMKYFLLSIFSSGLLLFGFSYLYGITGTTNIPAIVDGLAQARTQLAEAGTAAARAAAVWPGLAVVALVMILAGLGFRITAVPFHFYAPDVYQGTTTPAAALLAFFPKAAGFAALLRLLGLVPPVLVATGSLGQVVGEPVPRLLWILAAVTMSLGNVLALLQDNIKRMLAYSSVAHAGYMLIGLTVVPRLEAGTAGAAVGGVEALLFYLVAYGAMTVGAFAVLHYLDHPDRRVVNVDDLAGLGRTHPGTALLMVLFMCSLIGIPLTAGFAGKLMLFWNAMGLSGPDQLTALSEEARKEFLLQVRLYRLLAVIGVLNAAVGGWYYLRIIAVMYLREAIVPLPRLRFAPVLASIWVCAALTLGLGVYPAPLVEAIRSTIPRRAAEPRPAALAPAAGKAVAQQRR
jgi:NADH-quinone oxidoreductase subunit N